MSDRSISDEIDYLDSDIDQLQAEFNGFIEQLGDVLAAEQDTPGDAVPAPAEDASGSYTRIVWRRQRIQRLTALVSEIRSRVEV